jgi:membrane protein CcdC involved in cytochrome C biogenesis
MTPVGLILIAVLLLIRRTAFDWLNAHSTEWHIAPTAIVDGFMLFAAGLILGWRIEMFLRCRRLLSAEPDAQGSR